jgi:transposase
MVRCPKCAFSRAWFLSDGRLRCRRCRHRYTVLTSWDSSRLSDRTKHKLVELFSLGVPVYRMRFREIASLPAIERFFRRIRACCALHEHCRGPFEGSVECDETTFGGARHGKRGWGAAGKIIVFGLLQRNGIIRAVPLKGRRGAEVLRLIQQHTKPGSLYYTDDWQAYASLAIRGGHIVIRKDRGKPKGRDHINGIEGFWSYAKHWLYPYRGVPQKYFHLYLGEVCYRYNHRNKDLYPLIVNMLKKTEYSQIQPLLVRSS